MPFCPNCGIQADGNFCSQCGFAITQTGTTSGAVAAKPARASEQTLFQSGSIMVTSTRFVVGAQTYAINGLTSVRSYSEMPSRNGPVILILLGLLICGLSRNVNGVLIGGGLITAGVLWWRKIKPNYSVLLRTAAGEVKALTSKNQQFIGNIVQALNEALIVRG